MIEAHQDFQGKHYYEYLGQDPNAREKYEGEPWYGLAEQFGRRGTRSASTLPIRRSAQTFSPGCARCSPRHGRLSPGAAPLRAQHPHLPERACGVIQASRREFRCVTPM